MTNDQLLDELRNFYGTEAYHRTNPGLLVTDGVKFLADNAGCYWLLDMVWSYLPVLRKSRDTFFVVVLTKEGVRDPGAIFSIQDDIPPNQTYAQQAIEYTDFPLDVIVLYLSATEEEFVLMLRSEY